MDSQASETTSDSQATETDSDGQAPETDSGGNPASSPEESDHAEDGQSVSDVESDATRRRRPNRSLVALSATAVVLGIVAATMTGLYVRQSQRTDDRDQTITTRNQTIAAQKTAAEKARTRMSEQDAKIKNLEAKLIDPQGYESIKKCVQTAAALSKVVQSVPPVPGPQIPPGAEVISHSRYFAIPEGDDFLTGCLEAVNYLK